MSNLDHILNPQLLDQYFKELEQSDTSSATINRKKASLNQFQSWAKDHGYISAGAVRISAQPDPAAKRWESSTAFARPERPYKRLYGYAFLTIGLVAVILLLLNWRVPNFFNLLPKAKEAPAETVIVQEASEYSPPYPFALEAGPLTVPVINADGSLVLAGTAPKIKALNDTFAIEGQAIVLQTPFASDGNITLAPDGAGEINLRAATNIENANLTTGNLITGYVGNNTTSYDFIEFQGGATPQTRFRVDALGRVYLTGLQDQNLSSPINLSDPTHTTLPTGSSSILGGIQVALDASSHKDGLKLYDPTGSKYLSLSHDGTNAIITTNPSTGQLQLQTDVSITEGVNIAGILDLAQQLKLGNFSANPSSPAGKGALYYNTSTNLVKYYDGSSWQDIGLFTDGGDFTYLTSTTDDLALGGATQAAASFFFDVSANTLTSPSLKFDDSNLTTALPLTVSDTAINGNLAQGIVDAINDAYDAAVGSAGGLWTTTNGLIFPTADWRSVAIGGNSTASATLFFDAPTGSIGIGDGSPDDRLDIESSSLGYNFLFGSNGITLSTSGTSGLNIDTFGQLSLTTNQGAANALELVSTTGGIDISTGSSTRDIDILSGAGINLKAIGSDLTLSSGSPSYASGLVVDSGTGYIGLGDVSPVANLVVGSDTAAGTANGIGDAYIQNDLEVDGTLDLDGAFDQDGTTFSSIVSAGQANAIELIASAGGIDISTGSGSQNIDILSGNGLNLKAVGADITLSSGTLTYASGLVIDSATGYVGVGDASPLALFTVGPGDPFQVDASGNLTTSGDIAVNGDDITSDGALTLNATTYVRVGDSGTPGLASGDDDLYVEGDLEIDAILDLDGSFDMDGTTFDVNNTGAISLLTSSGTANAIQLVATAGGIDISTGSGSADIDILGGDVINLKAVGGNLNLSSGTSTAQSGLVLDTSGNVTLYGDIAVNGDDITSDGALTLNATTYVRVGDSGTPGTASGDDDLYVEGDLEIDAVLDLDGSFDMDGTTFDVNNTGAISLLTSSGTANAIQLVATAGGIDISTGSGSADIDILGGDVINLKAVGGNLNLSSGTSTAQSGLVLDTSGNLTAYGTIIPSGGIIRRTSGNILIDTATSGDVTIGPDTSLGTGDDLFFQDGTLAAVLPLTVADTALNANLTQGIVDAINDIYDSAVGGSGGGLWTAGTGFIYVSNTTQDVLIGGTASSSAKLAFTGIVGSSPTITSNTNTLKLNSDAGSATALQLVADQGGIQLSTGSGSQDIILQSGDAITLAAKGSDLTLSSGTTTYASGLVVDSATGYVGVADASPLALFTVGPGDPFQVDASGNLTTSGDIAVNGDDITSDGALTLNATTYVRVGDSGTPGTASGDDDLYVEGDLEIDAILDLDGSFDMDGTTFDVLNTGAVSLQTSSGTANAIQLVATAGGIDISTGSGTQNIDILSGNGLNLKAVGADITLSSGTTTYASGLVVDSATGYVGVADSSPAALFTVGSGDALQIDNSGNVTTTGDIAVNGDDITSDADLTITPSGGQLIVAGSINVGGITNVGYSAFSDSGTATTASTDDDVFIEDILEVDGTIDLDGAFDQDGTTFDVNNSGAISLQTSSGTANAIQLVATAGGIDISTGSGSADIDILSGDQINLRAGTNGITFSAGTSTAQSGLSIDTSSNLIINAQGDLRLVEATANGTNYTGFQAPASLAGDVLYTLPTADGTANYVLATNGSGTLSWIAVSGAGGADSAGLWSGSGGLIYPDETFYSVAIGATATSSAKFHIDATNGQLTTVDNAWLGLGSSAGRIEFDDQSVDEVNILSARVGIGDSTPDDLLDVEDASLGYNFLFGSNGITLSTSGTSAINIDSFGQISLTTNKGAADALELVSTAGGIDISSGSATGDIDILGGASINLTAREGAADALTLVAFAGGIDISTGSGTADIDILGGDVINLKAVGGAINLSSGTVTRQSGLAIDTSGNVTAYNQFRFGSFSANPTSMGTGAIIYRSDDNNLYYDKNGTWTQVGSGSGGGSNWTISNGSLYPINETLDLLIGGTSTASAKFAIVNVNSGTPTASVSGNLTLASQTAAPTITSTAGQDITLDASGTKVIVADDLQINGGDIRDSGGNIRLTLSPSQSLTQVNEFLSVTRGATLSAQIATDRPLTLKDTAGSTLYYVDNSANIYSGVANGATAVGFTFDTTNSLSTQGAKILSAKTGGTEKFYIDKDGNLYAAGTILSGTGDGVLMTNKSGATVAVRGLVIIDTSNNSSFTTTTTAYAKTAFGVVTGVGLGVTNDADGDGVCDANDICMVAMGGEVNVTTTNASTAAKGDYLYTSATAGSAVASAKQFDGLIGVVSSTANAASGYLKMIFKVQPQVTASAAIDKGLAHTTYRSLADTYARASETERYTQFENVSKAIDFDSFVDEVKYDSANSTVPIDANKKRVGLSGGRTLNNTNTDTASNSYLGANDANDTYYYDRTPSGVEGQDSTPSVLVNLGIDPNWYNGVSLVNPATASAQLASVPPPTNLSTTYNGSLLKASGSYAASAEHGWVDVTVRSVSTTALTARILSSDWSCDVQSATLSFGAAYSLTAGGCSASTITITAQNASYKVGDTFRIASWYLEPATANDRGAKAQFPERSYLVASDDNLDIIDADTLKLWMRFSQGTNYALGAAANNTPSAAHALNGRVYLATNGSSATGLYTLAFFRDSVYRTDATDWRASDKGVIDRNATNTYSVINTRVILQNVAVNDVHANVVQTATSPSTYKMYAATADDAALTVIHETDAVAYSYSDVSADDYNAVWITSGGELYGLNETQSQAEKWNNVHADTASELAGTPDKVWSGVSATGGTITNSGGYTIHTFTSSGTFTPGAPGNVEYLVVGGGGGGGSNNPNNGSGGGGAGGMLTGTGFAVTAQAYTVTVGAGGTSNNNGNDSVFSTITATGGGKGGNALGGAGTAGGSGGGGGGIASGSAPAGGTGTDGQGNNGGAGAVDANYPGGGGGGGGGAVGAVGSVNGGGNGGAGSASSISGSSVTYAGGGGGGRWNNTGADGSGGAGGGGAGGSNGTGVSGTANTGGGGGGGGAGGGGAGGSGIVIIRYLTSIPSLTASAATIQASSPDALSVTEATSIINGTSDTLYVTTNQGLSVIQDKAADETNGSVKYYTKDYISEEMVGDIRGMWPLNNANAASDFEDVSVKANNLTGTNVTANGDSVTGVRATATDLDGSTESLTIADDADLDFAAADTFAVGIWAKHNGAIATNEDYLITKADTTTGGYKLYMDASGDYCFAIDDDATWTPDDSACTSAIDYDDSLWHHIVGVKNGTTAIRLYVDGVEVANDTTIAATATLANTNAFYIGVDRDGTSNEWDGGVDEAFVTAEALTAAQIKHIYEVGKRALEGSHGTNDFKNNLDEAGTGTGATNVAKAVAVDFNNKYAYVGLDGAGADDGWVSKIDLWSDTQVDQYTTSTDPALADNDVTSLAVGYNLEIVGNDAIGARQMSLDSNGNNASGNYVSRTLTTPVSFTQAYLWVNSYVDSSDSSSSITVQASNDGGSNYVTGTLTNTDSNQDPTEREYFFQFSSAGSSLKVRLQFARDSTKLPPIYATRYGIAWIGSDAIGGAPGGNGLYTNNNSSVADGSYVEVAHNQSTTDAVTQGWRYNTNSSKWEAIDITDNEQATNSATVNFNTEANYTQENMAYAVTLTPSATSGDITLTLGSGTWNADARVKAGTRVTGNGGVATITGTPAAQTTIAATTTTNFTNTNAIASGSWSLYGTTFDGSVAKINSTSAYNSNAGTFATTSQAQLPQAFRVHSTVTTTIGGTQYLYVTGGYTTLGANLSTVYKATIDSSGNAGTFATTSQAQLPQGLRELSTVVATIGGTQYMYVTGGNNAAYISTVYKATIDSSANVGTFSTTNQGQVPKNLGYHSAITTAIGGTQYLYLIAGNGSTVYKATIDSSANIGTFATTSQAQLPQAYTEHTAVTATIGGTQYIYVIGGYSGGTNYSTVYKATIDSSGNVGTWATTSQAQLPQVLPSPSAVTTTVGGTQYVYVMGGSGSISTVYKATIDSSGNVGTFATTSQGQLPQGYGSGSSVTATIGGTQYVYVTGGNDGGGTPSSIVYKATIGPDTLSVPTSTTYSVATAGDQISTASWADIDDVDVTETLNSQTIQYAVSFDGRTTFYMYDSTASNNGWRPIARNNSGTWQYNSNTTAGVSNLTWTNATYNSQNGALSQAFGVTQNQMSGTTLAALTDLNWNEINGFTPTTNTLDFAAGLKTTDSSQIPQVDQINVDYTKAGHKIVQQDANTVRLYNYSGAAQNLRLDVITGGLGRNAGTVSLAPAAADTQAQDNTNAIWVNQTGANGALLKLQRGGTDILNLSQRGGDAALILDQRLSGDILTASASGTPRFTITNAGNVGIGDTSPDDLLDIENANLGYNFLFGSGGVTLSTSGTSGLNIDTFGQLSLTSNQGAATALELVSTAGGIDLSTGSSTGDIDILSGDAVNIKAVNGNISLSSGTSTAQSGVVIDTNGDATFYNEIKGDSTDSLRLQAGGTGTGSTGTGSIYFLTSSGQKAGRFDTSGLSDSNDATGGTITYSGNYTIHTFTSNGTFTPSSSGNVEYLVVGGGGGGGSSGGGGGGAGGFRTGTGFAVTAQSYSITVGAGGSSNQNGSNSVFSTITSTGGGAGGASPDSGSNGGSGGGGGGYAFGTTNGGSGTAGQGNNGGGNGGQTASPYPAGGGGGASAAGANAPNSTTSGNGGAGSASSISGSSVTYAGGGGGGNWAGSGTAGSGGAGGGGNGTISGNGGAGTANTGGGGGGAPNGSSGGSGGSGIVIIRYLTFQYGTFYLGATNTSSADLAEYYITGDDSITAGDVVTISNSKLLISNENGKEEEITTKGVLRKSEKPYDQKLIGIISTNPGVLMGSIDGDTEKADKRMLALSGRVPVKIDPDSEPIEIGDFLTSSDKPGLAMKATKAGTVIGKALENWTPESGRPNILVFVSLGQSAGELTAEGFLPDDHQKTASSAALVDSTDSLTGWIDTLERSVLAIANAVKSQFSQGVDLPEVESGGLGVSIQPSEPARPTPFTTIASASASIKANWDKLSKANFDIINSLVAKTQTLIVEDTFISPLVETERITTAGKDLVIDLAHLEGGVASHLPGKDGFGTLIVKGNASVSGQLTADTIEAGTISAKYIKADHIEGLDAKFGLISNDLEATLSALLAQSMTTSDASASEQMTMGDVSLSDAFVDTNAAFVREFLAVQGLTTLTDVQINGNLIADSISVLGDTDTLYIQPTGQGKISLLADLMTLDDTGQVTVNGNLSVTGHFDTKTLSVVEGLTAQDATISGSGTFAKLIIATPEATTSGKSTSEVESSNTSEVKTNASVGIATLAAGFTEAKIPNTQVTLNSLIYLTPTTTTQNRVLYLKTKNSCNGVTSDNRVTPSDSACAPSFTVAIDQPIATDIQFQYWIIN